MMNTRLKLQAKTLPDNCLEIALALKVKQALWKGGIQRSNSSSKLSNTPGLQDWSDLVSLFDAKLRFKGCGVPYLSS